MIQAINQLLKRFEQLFEMPGESDGTSYPDRPIRVTPPWAKWGATAFFMACLVLQFATFGHKALTWPFMRYPMFNAAFEPPVQHRVFIVYAQHDGGETHIVPEEVGRHFWQFDDEFAKPLFYEEPGSLGPLQARIGDWLGLDATGFRVERQTWQLIDGEIVVESEDKAFVVEAPDVE